MPALDDRPGPDDTESGDADQQPRPRKPWISLLNVKFAGCDVFDDLLDRLGFEPVRDERGLQPGCGI